MLINLHKRDVTGNDMIFQVCLEMYSLGAKNVLL